MPTNILKLAQALANSGRDFRDALFYEITFCDPLSGLGGDPAAASGSSGETPPVIPEPGTIVLVGLAAGAFALRRMRRSGSE